MSRRTRFAIQRHRDRGPPVPLPIVVVIAVAILFALAGAAFVLFTGSAQAATPAVADEPRPAAPAVSSTPGTAPSPADLRRGQLLFLQCRACHGLQADREGKIGPPLGGFYGQPAARLPDFQYSAALAGVDLTWDAATLDRWLTRPSEVVPGTTMVYTGLADAADRRRLIQYLREATAARE